MKIILFRFEKEKINFMECDIISGSLTHAKKEKISLNSSSSSGEKYKKVLDELFQINAKYAADLFAYLPSQGYMGKIDEVRFANEAMLNLFCYTNEIQLLSLAPPTVRQTLSIKDVDFKQRVESEKKNLSSGHSMTKSDIMLDALTYLSLLRSTF